MSVKQSISQTVTQRRHRVLDLGRDDQHTWWDDLRQLKRTQWLKTWLQTHSMQSNVCTIIAANENAFPHNITTHTQTLKAKTQDISCSSAQLNNVSHHINCLKLTFNIIFFLIFQVEVEPWCVMKQFLIFFSFSCIPYPINTTYTQTQRMSLWAWAATVHMCRIFIQLYLPQ